MQRNEAEVYHHRHIGPLKPDVWEKVSRVFYPEGSIITRPGLPVRHFYYIHTGKVRLSVTGSDGMEKVISYAGPGEFVCDVPFFEGAHWYTAQVVRPLQASAFDRENVAAIRHSHPEFVFIVLESMAHKAWMLANQMMAVAYDSPDTRIARILVEMLARKRVEPDGLPITHQELAALAGTSRVTVTKTLNVWRSQGLVQMRKGNITVTKIDWLQKRARGVS
ncbi:MAG TPA: Crp/Fnr family transcriptional regulator [Symbiobacteriaceae bacterium]|nr:Crp/Fnr family transcriptional regulator [Symbiobacteriaceae bacterium]